MNILSVVGTVFCALVVILLLKSINSQLSLLVIIGVCVYILVFAVSQVSIITEFMTNIAVRSELDTEYLKIILKALGICYLCEFACSICRDLGQSSLASKLELACKISIVILSIPLFNDILELISKLW